MTDLEKDRDENQKRIMDRRVLQVTTLQELGKIHTSGKLYYLLIVLMET